MSTEDNRALLRRYMSEVWEHGEPEAVKRFVAPSYRRHTSPATQPLDLAGQIQRLKGFREAFPDIGIQVENVIAEDDSIALRSTLRGTHLGQFLGIPPTGRKVTVNIIDVIRIEDGLFAEHWGGPDLFDLLRQLGATFEAAKIT